MYKNYIITKQGSIISKYTGEQLYVHVNKKGYHFVRLYVDGKSKTYLVHRLIAKMYISNPNGLPEVNHKDGNKSNNNDWNLEWVTGQQNVDHAMLNGLIPLGDERPNAKFNRAEVVEIRNLRNIGHTYYEIAEVFECSFQTVEKICKFKTYKHVK